MQINNILMQKKWENKPSKKFLHDWIGPPPRQSVAALHPATPPVQEGSLN
jgi:hypothetical protein